jgi:iron complex transport system ATP-binding protein
MTSSDLQRDAPLRVESLYAGYGGDPVVRDVSLTLSRGELVALLGPNGSGKSTLLRCLARLHEADGGRVLLDGEPISEQPTREVARRLAFLPQELIAPPGLTVRDQVGLGRHPHRSWLRVDREGPDAIEAAMRDTGLVDLADRRVETLSGGQRQRVWIAMALAQGAELLLLDEPTNHLDPSHRSEVMETLLRLAHANGRGILVVLHDLVLAAAICDRVAMLDKGRIVAEGSPREVLTSQLLGDVYGTPFTVLEDSHSGRPVPIQRMTQGQRRHVVVS